MSDPDAGHMTAEAMNASVQCAKGELPSRVGAEDLVAHIVTFPRPVLALLYRTLYAAGLRVDACDHEVSKLNLRRT